MKTILTFILILSVSISQAQPTLEGLLLRIQVIENTSMTIVDYNKIVDSIARRRDSVLRNEMQGWVNAGLKILRVDMGKMDLERANTTSVQQNKSTGYMQDQMRELFLQLEATKLNLQNIIKALNAIQ